MIPNRNPSTIWSTYGPGSCYVRTEMDDEITISFPNEDEPGMMWAMHVSRKEARLLAKRINQCLDETMKK